MEKTLTPLIRLLLKDFLRWIVAKGPDWILATGATLDGIVQQYIDEVYARE